MQNIFHYLSICLNNHPLYLVGHALSEHGLSLIFVPIKDHYFLPHNSDMTHHQQKINERDRRSEQDKGKATLESVAKFN